MHLSTLLVHVTLHQIPTGRLLFVLCEIIFFDCGGVCVYVCVCIRLGWPRAVRGNTDNGVNGNLFDAQWPLQIHSITSFIECAHMNSQFEENYTTPHHIISHLCVCVCLFSFFISILPILCLPGLNVWNGKCVCYSCVL